MGETSMMNLNDQSDSPEEKGSPSYGSNLYRDFSIAYSQIARVGRQFKRENKIRLLEEMLYDRILEGEPADDIVKAIEVLQQNRVLDKELLLKRDSLFLSQVNRSVRSLFLVAFVITVTSYLLMPLCDYSKSKFCRSIRIIPNSIDDIFYDPSPHLLLPLLVLPAVLW